MEANKMHHYLPENVVDKDFVSLLSVSALKIPYIHGPHMSPRWFECWNSQSSIFSI